MAVSGVKMTGKYFSRQPTHDISSTAQPCRQALEFSSLRPNGRDER